MIYVVTSKSQKSGNYINPNYYLSRHYLLLFNQIKTNALQDFSSCAHRFSQRSPLCSTKLYWNRSIHHLHKLPTIQNCHYCSNCCNRNCSRKLGRIRLPQKQLRLCLAREQGCFHFCCRCNPNCTSSRKWHSVFLRNNCCCSRNCCSRRRHSNHSCLKLWLLSKCIASLPRCQR